MHLLAIFIAISLVCALIEGILTLGAAARAERQARLFLLFYLVCAAIFTFQVLVFNIIF